MTLEQFLKALGETPRDWRLMKRLIRTGWNSPSGRCPMEAVNSGIALGEPYAAAVMSAADGRYGHNPALRAALLQRTGLTEPEGPEPSA